MHHAAAIGNWRFGGGQMSYCMTHRRVASECRCNLQLLRAAQVYLAASAIRAAPSTNEMMIGDRVTLEHTHAHVCSAKKKKENRATSKMVFNND